MKKEFLISTIISSVACLISIVALIFALLPYKGTDDGLDENPQGLEFYMQGDGTYIVDSGNSKYQSSIVFPETYQGGTVVGIDNQAFWTHYTVLESVTIPKTVTMIGYQAFSGCTSLTTIKFEGTVEQWNAIEKGWDWNYRVPATEVICSDGTVTLEQSN